jgi:hypothetical protein
MCFVALHYVLCVWLQFYFCFRKMTLLGLVWMILISTNRHFMFR